MPGSGDILMRARVLLLLGGLLLVLGPSLVRLYLLMPFPGSQELDSVRLAYAAHRTRAPALAAGVVIAAAGSAAILRRTRSRKAVASLALALAATGGLFVAASRFTAESMFKPPARVAFAAGTAAALPPSTLVLGVVLGDRARAYPVRLLAYHHLVLDELAGSTLLPSY